MGARCYTYSILPVPLSCNILRLFSIDIIADYLGKFDDEGITGELVRSIGTKNGKIATERIIDSFFGLSETSKCNHATFYDTALTNICDKRFADKYVEMISNPKYARWLLGLMKLLGRWKNEKAKRVMLGYLGSDNEDMVNMTVQALKYYKHDQEVIAALKLSLTKEHSEGLTKRINSSLQFASK